MGEDYVTLLMTENQNNIDCSMTDGTITFSNISSILNNLSSDDFLRLGVYRLTNDDQPDPSVEYGITFLDSSKDTGVALASGTVTTPYQISPTPTNIQFDTI